MKKFMGIVLSAALLITGTAGAFVPAMAGSPAAMADITAATADGTAPVATGSAVSAGTSDCVVKKLKGAKASNVQLAINSKGKLEVSLANYSEDRPKKKGGKLLSFNKSDSDRTVTKLPDVLLYQYRVTHGKSTYTLLNKGNNKIILYRYRNKDSKLLKKKKFDIRALMKSEDGGFQPGNLYYVSPNKIRLLYTVYASAGAKNRVMNAGSAILNLKSGKVKAEVSNLGFQPYGCDGNYIYGIEYAGESGYERLKLCFADAGTGEVKRTITAPDEIKNVTCRNGKVLCNIKYGIYYADYTKDTELTPVLNYENNGVFGKDFMGVFGLAMKSRNVFYVVLNDVRSYWYNPDDPESEMDPGKDHYVIKVKMKNRRT